MADQPLQIRTLSQDEQGNQVDVTPTASAFEAGGHGREMALWNPSTQSIDSEYLYERDTIVGRARDITKNSPLVAAGVTTVKNSVVGETFALSSKPKLFTLRGQIKEFDDEWEEIFQEEVEEKFSLYCESLDYLADAEGTKTFTDIIRLGVAIELVDGEFFATSEWIDEPFRPFKTAFQILEGDRVGNRDGSIGNERLRAGVEKDRYGRPIAYHIRDAHPNDIFTMRAPTWRRVPAKTAWGRQQVIHIFEQNRASATRGVSEMAAALKQMNLTKKFEDLTIQNVLMRSLIAMSIESEAPTADILQQMGGATDMKAIQDYAKGFLTSVHKLTGGRMSVLGDGVRIPIFHPGTRLNANAVGDGGPLGSEFEVSLHRKVSGALGMGYEEYARDFSNTNYSSARASMSMTIRNMRVRKKKVADRIASAIFRNWLEEAIQTGQITSMPRRARGSWLYEGMNMAALSNAEWIGASRASIDELKEVKAALEAVRGGISTLEEECMRRGLDWRAVFKQLARESHMREKLGISIDGENAPMTPNERQMNAMQESIEAIMERLDDR